jgi:hypothetical protein
VAGAHISIDINWAALGGQRRGWLALLWLLSVVIGFTAVRGDAAAPGLPGLLFGVLTLFLGPVGVILSIAVRLFRYFGDI